MTKLDDILSGVKYKSKTTKEKIQLKEDLKAQQAEREKKAKVLQAKREKKAFSRVVLSRAKSHFFMLYCKIIVPLLIALTEELIKLNAFRPRYSHNNLVRKKKKNPYFF